MSKYLPLNHHLGQRTGDQYAASFAELEEVLGFPLPKTARSNASWWTAEDKPHHRAWLDAGWRVGEVDRTLGSVVFHRGEATHGALGQQPPGALAEASSEVQPAAMKEAAEEASKRMHAQKKAARAVLIGGGITALVVLRTLSRALFRRRR